MSLSDPIADMLTRIRNANLRHHKSVAIPYSKMKESIISVFLQEGFIGSYRVDNGDKRNLIVTLKYDQKKLPVIRGLKRESKPGRRIYSSVKDLGCVLNGQGIYVVSTSKGVFSDNECRKQSVCGEILCSIY